MERHDEQVKRIVLTAVEECTICGRALSLSSIDVLGRRGDLWVLTVCCNDCENRSFIAALLINEHESAGNEVLELSPEEVHIFGASPTISARDVLEMHEFLAEFGGSLAGHLSTRRPA